MARKLLVTVLDNTGNIVGKGIVTRSEFTASHIIASTPRQISVKDELYNVDVIEAPVGYIEGLIGLEEVSTIVRLLNVL